MGNSQGPDTGIGGWLEIQDLDPQIQHRYRRTGTGTVVTVHWVAVGAGNAKSISQHSSRDGCELQISKNLNQRRFQV